MIDIILWNMIFWPVWFGISSLPAYIMQIIIDLDSEFDFGIDYE